MPSSPPCLPDKSSIRRRSSELFTKYRGLVFFHLFFCFSFFCSGFSSFLFLFLFLFLFIYFFFSVRNEHCDFAVFSVSLLHVEPLAHKTGDSVTGVCSHSFHLTNIAGSCRCQTSSLHVTQLKTFTSENIRAAAPRATLYPPGSGRSGAVDGLFSSFYR